MLNKLDAKALFVQEEKNKRRAVVAKEVERRKVIEVQDIDNTGIFVCFTIKVYSD